MLKRVSRSGADLARLMLASFRALADRATAELATRGYEDIRPAHAFALRSIRAGADNASELGRRMSVTKQAAAKTITTLEERGYIAREPDPADRRRMRLQVTSRGLAMLGTAEEIFEDLRDELKRQVGAKRISALEKTLAEVVGNAGINLDSPGWVGNDPGGLGAPGASEGDRT
jgi:DNA-binding MarR family transcriptional regulator